MYQIGELEQFTGGDAILVIKWLGSKIKYNQQSDW